MSSGLQNKMNGYEVTPPPGVWEKIVAELDDSDLGYQFPTRLKRLEVIPPVNIWHNIADTLNESEFITDFAGRLIDIKVAPPPTIWNAIQTSLDAEQEVAVPAFRRFSPFLKYAAAAAIITFLVWGGMQLFTKESINSEVAKKDQIKPTENSNPTSISQIVTAGENITLSDVSASLEEARNDAALEQSKKTYAKLDIAVTRNKIKNVADFFFVTDEYEPTGTRGLNIEEPPMTDIADRYIMLMTPDGNIIRMSKKLGNIVCCVSGQEQDKGCADQMKKWREKLASPGANHSSGNVLDILNLINSMKDN